MIGQLITLGIGTPSNIGILTLMGLSPNDVAVDEPITLGISTATYQTTATHTATAQTTATHTAEWG